MQVAKSAFQIKYIGVMLAGALTAVAAYQILELEYRYALAIVGGVLTLCAGLTFIKHLDDFLVFILIFNTSFDRFGKWLFPQTTDIVFAHGISLGIAELLLVMAYTSWFIQIFVARKESLPRLSKIDFLVVLLFFSQFISMIGTYKVILSILDIIYNIKHVLIYFYLAHKVKRRHYRMIIVILLFTILLQSAIGCYERITGNVGIGHSKISAEQGLGKQIVVPGIEHTIRAEGTTGDSHELGLFFVMLLPVPLVLTGMHLLKLPERITAGLILIFGIIGLVVTFTRSGWVCFAISAVFAMAVIVFFWKQKIAILSFIGILLGMSLFYPQGYKKIYDRFQNAPWEVMEERFDQAKTALGVWRKNFFFGCGAANYMLCLDDYETKMLDTGELPVHVLALYIAAEIGLIGALAFYGIIFLAMLQCAAVLKSEDLLIKGLGLALLTAFIGYLLDGLTSPLGRNIIPYYMLWVYIGLSMTLKENMLGKEVLAALPKGWHWHILGRQDMHS